MKQHEGNKMKLKIKIEKEDDTYLASCEDFNLRAEGSSEKEAAKGIEEAFYFAIQYPDFVSTYRAKLAGLFSENKTKSEYNYLEISIPRFLKNVKAYASTSPAVCD